MQQVYGANISILQFYTYNFICVGFLLYLLWKNRNSPFFSLIIILFFAGTINDLFGAAGRNLFRIAMLTITLFYSIRSNALSSFRCSYPRVFWLSVVWCAYNVIDSIFIQHDSMFLALSLLSKFMIPLLLFTVVLDKCKDDEELLHEIYWLFGTLITIQIALAIVKIIICGGFLEGWIGSITGLSGGGAGTSLPMLGLMWLALKNDMEFSRRDILFALGLLIIGFAAGKRAVWILFPLTFLALYVWIYRKNIWRQIIIVACLAPLFVYFAVRIVPTFNPENKTWGSFDIEYATDYILKYSAGIDEEHEDVQSGTGRLGAVLWMIDKSTESGKQTLLGRGNEFMTYAGRDNYYNESYFDGITSKGSITGIVNTFFVFGLIGVIIYVVCIFSLFGTNQSRFNLLLLTIVIIDYIFYNAQIMGLMPLLLLALFLSFFSPQLIDYEETTDSNAENDILSHGTQSSKIE